jgi:hypothetical protein
MRVLRTTMYASPDDPMTGVVRENDLTDTLESFIQSHNKPDVFVAFEIVTLPDGTSHEEAVYAACEHIDPERERNMAILYFWVVGHLPLLSGQGLISTKDASPLTAEEIARVVDQIVVHPTYQSQRIIVHDETGEEVTR